MADKKLLFSEIKELLPVVSGRVAVTAQYQADAMNAEQAIREKFNEIVGTDPNKRYNNFKKNQYDIFELIIDTIEESLVKNINAAYDHFVDFRQFNQGDRATFQMPRGRKGLRRFIAKIALGVTPKRTKLDKATDDMNFFAIGGGVHIEFEDFLDGKYSWSELTSLFEQELTVATYEYVAKAVGAAVTGNKFKKTHTEVGGTFSPAGMAELISYTRTFGNGGADIVCSPEFAARIRPEDGFISEADKSDRRQYGHIGVFNGASVSVIPQAYDEAGKPVFPTNVAFVFPTGNRKEDKFIKLGYEGQTQMRESTDETWKMNFDVYKKLGVMTIINDGVSLYKA